MHAECGIRAMRARGSQRATKTGDDVSDIKSDRDDHQGAWNMLSNSSASLAEMLAERRLASGLRL